MSDNVLIKVEGVSKKFCRTLKRSLWYGVSDVTGELLGRKGSRNGLRKNEFWAVDDISFTVKRGECVGLIGRNGAGKTTLLRMLNGLIKPDKGRLKLRGKVGALIALGAGFNPILTGRENIYVNAAILGMSKPETDKKMEEIIDFAELEQFIDAPVQSYSSGMNVRLGFATAAVLIEPDILLLDEVLAVGDIGFAIKCLNRVRSITNNSAVVFVSHNMQQITRFCSRLIVMQNGVGLIDTTNLAEGIDEYFGLARHEVQTTGSGEAEIIGASLIVDGEENLIVEPTIPHGAGLGFRLKLAIHESVSTTVVHVNVTDAAMNQVITLPVCSADGQLHPFKPGFMEFVISMGKVELAAGKYSVTIGVVNKESSVVIARVQGIMPFRISAEKAHWGKIVRNVTPSELKHKESRK
jgi:lipopolysaccharide transport system ATP-binding protein